MPTLIERKIEICRKSPLKAKSYCRILLGIPNKQKDEEKLERNITKNPAKYFEKIAKRIKSDINDGEQEAVSIVVYFLSDHFGVRAESLTHPAFKKDLKEWNLFPDDLTPEIIGMAHALDHRHARFIERKHNVRISSGFLPQPKPKPIEKTTEQTLPQITKGKRPKLFGHPVTAVIRWMGTDAWDKAEVRKAFKALGISIASATIDAQLRAGKKGERGAPAPISRAEAKTLYEAAKSLEK